MGTGHGEVASEKVLAAVQHDNVQLLQQLNATQRFDTSLALPDGTSLESYAQICGAQRTPLGCQTRTG